MMFEASRLGKSGTADRRPERKPSKAAALSLSPFLAREWAKSEVRVNTVTPGFFPAEQNRTLLFNGIGASAYR
jgi:NAD(P)-dependent dehydrogenase (short-subunit alcohol dehydrogenase family)